MRLIEKDAKEVLKGLGIRVPNGFFLDWEQAAWPADKAWSGPYYLKAQVLAGRRGKGGLVQRCDAPEDVARVLSELHGKLTPDACAGFWCEEACPHEEEWFVACDIDRSNGQIRGHVSREGGKEVALVQTIYVKRADAAEQLRTLPGGIQALLLSLADALPRLDALSLEINPCIIAENGEAIALDGKIELDDAAYFRHPEWKSFAPLSLHGAVSSELEKKYLEYLTEHNHPLLGHYVELSGNIAMVLAGGGASLVAMDALKRAGGKAANYLELSGNPDPDFLRGAAKVAFSHPDIKAIWIAGSFANFTNIETTVVAILQAVEESGLKVPVFIRRDGPGASEAEAASHAWAKRYGVPLVFQRGTTDLAESANALVASLA